jgi:hypothetical protein
MFSLVSRRCLNQKRWILKKSFDMTRENNTMFSLVSRRCLNQKRSILKKSFDMTRENNLPA